MGLIIDWWMTEKFESEISQQMNNYLDALQHTLLHGSDPLKADVEVELVRSQGLTEALPLLCGQLTAAYRNRFYSQIVTRETGQ